MKKNFFKKLSFVLAFAMVLSVLAPASGVFAAKAPKLNAKSKYLHLAEDSEYGANKFNFNIDGTKGKGWKYAWTSSDKKVATVNAKNGVTTAKGAGTATITVKITDKDGKKVENLKAKVTVRDNITEVAISNPLEDGRKLGVGEEYDFNRSYVTDAGLKKGSKAITRWTVEQEGDVKTATIDDKGVFVAEAAGEYEVIARSFQSKAKYDAWVKDAEANADNVTAISEAYKVEVAASIVDVKQVNTTKVDVTFDTDVSEEVTKDNLKVHSLIGTTKVNQLVKDVKFNEEGTVATVEMYVAFTGETEYVVSYKETEASFVAAKVAASEVAKVELTFDTLEYAKGPKTLDFKLTNAEGVDITTSTLKGQVTASVEGDTGFLGSNNDLYLNKGETAIVNMVFHTYEYDEVTFEEHVVKGTAVVRAIEEVVATLGTIDWTLSQETYIEKVNWDKDKKVTQIAAEDNGYSIFAKAKLSDDSNADATKFTFATSNDSVLIVDSSGTVYPVKQGVATIIISYDGVVREAVNVTIAGKRVVSVFSVNKSVVNISNSASVMATDEFELTVKDQLGQDWNNVNFTVEPLPGNPSGKSPVVQNADYTGKKIAVDGNGAGKGAWRYLVKGHDRQFTITVNVQEPTADGREAVRTWKLTLDKTNVDTAISNKKAVKEVTPTLLGYAANGVACFKADLTGTDSVDGKYIYKLGDKEIKTDSIGVATLEGTVSGSSISGSSISGSSIKKMDKGSYIVTAYEIVDGKEVLRGTARFTVVDTTVNPTYVLEENTVSANTVIDAVREAIKVSLDGNVIDDESLKNVTYVVAGKDVENGDNDPVKSGSIYVKSVKFTKNYDLNEDGDNLVAVEYTVNVNRTIYIR